MCLSGQQLVSLWSTNFLSGMGLLGDIFTVMRRSIITKYIAVIDMHALQEKTC